MRFNLTLRLLNEYMQMDPSHFIKTTLLTLGLLISGCSGSESGGSRTTGVNLDEGNVTMMLEGQTYELVPAGGAGDGATVQSWRWSDRPIIEGALSQCASIQDFDSPRAATRLEAACSVPAKCNLSFDQVSSVELDGGGQSRFSVRVPVLKADVGVTYRLEATDSSGQTSVGNFTFCLLAINEAPFAENDAFTVTEGIPLVVSGDSGINLLTNDSDDINVGNQALSVSSTPVRPPTQAISFSLQPDGGFTYFYEGDATVVGGTRISDSFQYEITDGSFTSVGTVDLTIVAVDNPPVLNEPLPAQQFIAGVPVDVDFSGFFSDPEDGDLFFSATGLPTGGDLLLTPLGVLTGSPAATDTGEFEVLVEAADQQNSAVGLVSVIVGGNLPPTSTQIPAQEVVFGELFSLDASGFFSDPEDGELVYSLTTAPATEIQINPDTGLITGLITSAGDYQFSVSATDTTDGSATVNFVVTQLAQPNRAPTFDGQINSQSVTIDTGINPASGEFSDPDDDTLTYTINNLPAGLVFNENTGVLSGTPTRLGESVLIITASDPDGLSVSSNAFTIGVTAIPNNAPTFAGTIANQFGNVGTPISPISGNFSDDDGDELQFSSTTLPAGLVINATSGVISGTPAETGTTNVAITATDPRQASATSNIFDIVVAPEINNPPVVTSVSPSSSISVQAEDSATVQINVDDEDTNTLIYSGASNSPTVATVSGGSNGVFTINALSAGSTTLTLTVTDDASQQTTQSINLTVTAIPNVAPVIVGRTPAGSINLDQGDTTAITLTVTDEDLSSLSFSGSTNDAVIAAVTTNADGSFTVTGISEGSTNIILRVEDSQGLAASTSVPVTVSAPPNGAPVITGRTPAAGSLTLAPGDVQIVNLTVTDEDLATVEYSAQSNAPAIASVTVTAANRIRIVAQSDGVATISMTVTDAGGLTDVDTINITVDTPNVAPAITGRTPAASTINLEPGDTQNMTLTVTDESTGTLSYSALTNDSGVVTVSVNAAGTFVITAVDDGDTTIDLTVTDDGNLTDSISVPVSVNTINVAPDITSRSPSTPTIAMLTGETQGMTLTVTDESPATLNYSASSSDPTRATVTVNATGDFTISAQAAGQTTLTLTVEDNGGLTDSILVPVDVTTPNQAPAITGRTPAASTINLEPGDTQNMTLTVTDESTGTLSYSAVTNNSDVVTVSVNAAGTFVITAVGNGDTTIDLTVTDDGNLTDSISVPVSVSTVNVAPEITSRSPSTPTIAMLAGETQGMTLTVTDESLATLIYSASSSDPTRATVTVNATGDFTISAQAAGQTTLTLTVEDNGGLTDSILVPVDVTTPNQAPAITGRTPAASTINLEPDDTQNMTLTVTDESLATLIYSASSSDLAVAIVTVDATGNFTISAQASGEATLTLTVEDNGGLTDSILVPVDVTTPNQAPAITGRTPAANTIALVAGTTQQLTLDVDDESVATLDYEAVSDSEDNVTVTVNAAGIFVISAISAGDATLRITVTDEGSLSDFIDVPVSVVAANLPPVIDLREPAGDLLLETSQSLDVELTVSDEAPATLVFDASASPTGIVTVTPGANGVFSLVAEGPGTTTVTLQVTDAGGLFATEVFDVTVADPDLPPVITSRSPATDIVLSPGDFQSVSFVIDDEALATVQISAVSSVETVATVDNGANNTIDITALISGSTVVTFTVTDAGGQSVTDTMTVTVDAPPVIASRSPAGNISVGENDFVAVTLNVTDEAPATLTYAATSGNELIATVLVNASNQIVITGEIAGTTIVTVTVTDEESQSDTVEIPVTVIVAGQADDPLADSGESDRA